MKEALGDKDVATREDGLTLVEVLVSMALLALLTQFLMGGVGLGTRVWETTTSISDALDSLQGARRALREIIISAYPLSLKDDKGTRITMHGSRGELELTSTLPFEAAGQGLQRVSLGRQIVDGQYALVATWHPERRAQFSLNSGESRKVLVSQIADVEFRYLAASDDSEPGWVTTWTSRRDLPRAISIDVTFPQDDPRTWPTAVFAPRIRVDSECLVDHAGLGCRGR